MDQLLPSLSGSQMSNQSHIPVEVPQSDSSMTTRAVLGPVSGNPVPSNSIEVSESSSNCRTPAKGKRKHAAKTPGVKYNLPMSVTADKKELFNALDKYARFEYTCTLNNECYHECIVQIFGCELSPTDPLYLAAKDKLLRKFKTWKNTMLNIIEDQVQMLLKEDRELPTTVSPMVDVYNCASLQRFFTNRYQIYNAAAFFDHAKDMILWEESSEYARDYFLQGVYVNMAVVTKLFLDHEQNPLNPETVQFDRNYLLRFFDGIAKRTELSKLRPSQLQPKRPKLLNRRAKRLRTIPDPNDNKLIMMPTTEPPPEPREVTTAFSMPYRRTLLGKKPIEDTDDDNDNESEGD